MAKEGGYIPLRFDSLLLYAKNPPCIKYKNKDIYKIRNYMIILTHTHNIVNISTQYE